MFSARLARSSATPLRSATRSTNPTGAFRRSYASSTAHETHPHTGTSHKQKSDLPWVVGSLAVFGPLLFYVSQPNIGGGQHVEHAKEAVAHKVADLSDKVPDSVTDAAKGAYDKAASAVGAKSSKAEEVKDQAADKAEDVKDAAKDKAGEAKDKAEEKAGTTAGDLKQKASDAIDAVSTLGTVQPTASCADQYVAQLLAGQGQGWRRRPLCPLDRRDQARRRTRRAQGREQGSHDREHWRVRVKLGQGPVAQEHPDRKGFRSGGSAPQPGHAQGGKRNRQASATVTRQTTG